MTRLAEIFDVPAETKGALIVPSRFEALMTGTGMALVEPNNRVSLVYTDDTIARAFVDEPAKENWLALVDQVQDACEGERQRK